MSKLIRFSWVSSLILLFVFFVLILRFKTDSRPDSTSYHENHCSFYCETSGCRHLHLLGRHHALMKWQVRAVHRIGSSGSAYEQVNNLIYWYLIGGFWIISGLYLINLGAAKNKLVEGVLALLFVAILVYAGALTNVNTLFRASVYACLYLTYRTGYSLYDVYMVLFGFGIPIGTASLFFLAGIKYSLNRFMKHRANLSAK